MNVFVIDRDPAVAAQSLVDSHLIKMQLETAQLLSTAYYLRAGYHVYEPQLYAPTHVRHPCTLNLTTNWAYVEWLFRHAEAMASEHKRRWQHSRTHASFNVSLEAYKKLEPLFEIKSDCFVAPLAMPKELCNNARFAFMDDAVHYYRRYYNVSKRHLFAWTNAKVPDWIEQQVHE